MSLVEAAPYFADVAGGSRDAHAVWLVASDGVRLRAGHWPGSGRGTVLLLPGRTEVLEKYAEVAATLGGEGWAVLSLDWRGQGLSTRTCRDPGLGHVAQFDDYQRDIAALLSAAAGMQAARPWVMLAHSMGGCIGLRTLIHGAPVAAAAFCAPMWGLPLGRAVRLVLQGVALAGGWRGQAERAVPGERSDFALATARFDDNFLTTDRAQFDRMQAQVRAHPELALGAPTLGWLAAAVAETARLAQGPAPTIPALAAVGSLEKIVDTAAVAARMQDWPGGRFLSVPGGEHELMMEAPARRRCFLDAALALFAAQRAR